MSKLRQLLILLTASLVIVVLLFFGISNFNSIVPAGIVIHHAAVAPNLAGTPLDAPAIDRIHERRGYEIFYRGAFYHIGYHYVILPDGTVQHGRPEHCKGAHTHGYNSYIGICLVGDFSSKDNLHGERGLIEPTEAQMIALSSLVRTLRAKYAIPPQAVIRHKDVNPLTECPGDRFPFEALRNSIR